MPTIEVPTIEVPELHLENGLQSSPATYTAIQTTHKNKIVRSICLGLLEVRDSHAL
jgi:hypothetical protein